ncbi:hypothetical protein [Streptomyces sp. M1013]|nr:hypothetical protein [Streptomyces sp. M1013]
MPALSMTTAAWTGHHGTDDLKVQLPTGRDLERARVGPSASIAVSC